MFEKAQLFETAQALRSGSLGLIDYIDIMHGRLAWDDEIKSFLPEPNRYRRLEREAVALMERFPDPANRPPLYGVLVGVKDIFHVDGMETHAGSALPADVLSGAQASSVTRLIDAGAIVMGKTVTTEFAYFEPGPTRNPHQLAHTPGGSSSGSAAAVAAGFCPLALGTQTIGSVIRPAAYCGVVGFKPSYGRISTDGVIPISSALDHVGMFTQDVAGMELAASVLFRTWNASLASATGLPRLGIPVGAYLTQAGAEARAHFDSHVSLLEAAGYEVQRIPLLDDIQTISEQTYQIMAVQMSQVHHEWFAQYAPLYRPRTRQMIETGQQVTPDELTSDLAMQRDTREIIAAAMDANGIDLWISPAATNAAPLGLNSTGSPAMNLPWTLTGFPTITLPTTSRDADDLPFGLQITGAAMDDERLLHWSRQLSRVLKPE
ncbi:MAG: amidase [Chloroflexi bacterium]|nr:amidase [Chloroflexota bacterium]